MLRKYSFLPIFLFLIMSLAWWSLREGYSLSHDSSGILSSAFHKEIEGEVRDFHAAHDAILRHSLTHPLAGTLSKYSKAHKEGSAAVMKDLKQLRGVSELNDEARLELLETLDRISQEIEGMKFALEHSAHKTTMGSEESKSLEIEELKDVK